MQGGPLGTQLDSLRDTSKATDQGSLLLSFPKGGCVVSYGVVLVKIRIKCTKKMALDGSSLPKE